MDELAAGGADGSERTKKVRGGGARSAGAPTARQELAGKLQSGDMPDRAAADKAAKKLRKAARKASKGELGGAEGGEGGAQDEEGEGRRLAEAERSGSGPGGAPPSRERSPKSEEAERRRDKIMAEKEAQIRDRYKNRPSPEELRARSSRGGAGARDSQRCL